MFGPTRLVLKYILDFSGVAPGQNDVVLWICVWFSDVIVWTSFYQCDVLFSTSDVTETENHHLEKRDGLCGDVFF